MSNENKNIEEIFSTALEFDSADKRRHYLDDCCANDPELRKRVEGLLEAYAKAGSFLEQSPDQFATATNPSSAELAPTQPPKPERQLDADSRKLCEPPGRFGDYELLQQIDRGGMGMVYKARQISLNRVVAIKMILSGQFASDAEVQRFFLEAEAAANLDHPGIVPVFDVGSCGGQHFYSMGFVDGKSLAAQLKAGGPVAPREAAFVAKKIATAAHAAHQQGIVHRDLKPANILIDKNGEPRVTDFGLAKHVEDDCHLTATGMVIGTPSYMPPEQASGKLEDITVSADVYSVGAILYEMLTGKPPFHANSQMDILMQVLQDEPVAPRQIDSSIPKDLEAICLKCLEKKPTDRYRTASDLAADLGQFLAGEPIVAKNDLMRRLRKWSLREPVLAAHLLGITAMMIIILINYWIFGSAREISQRYLFRNELILVIWAAVAVLLQKTDNLVRAKSVIPLIWAGMNPLFLTVALGMNQAPRGTLFSLYILLVVTTVFFRRVDLVVTTTLASLVGYIMLIAIFPEPDTFGSYYVIFAMTLAVTGIMLSFQVMRLNRLSQKDSA